MQKHITLFGGTGFIGRQLAAQLVNEGYAVQIVTRNVERHKALKVLPTAKLVEVNTMDGKAMAALLAKTDAVINLVGILHGTPAQFDAAHHQFAQRLVSACVAAGVKRLIHLSALNADATNAPSEYLRSKGRGEQAILKAQESGIATTIFRPSIVFGHEDGFYNLFNKLLAVSPVLPVARPKAKFAPVYVGDVVSAILKALADTTTHNQIYHLGGPEIFTFEEIVHYIAKASGQKRLIVGLPDGLAKLQASVMGKLPIKLFTTDNFQSLLVDSVCPENGLQLKDLGIEAQRVDVIMGEHLARRGGQGRTSRYDDLRRGNRDA